MAQQNELAEGAQATLQVTVQDSDLASAFTLSPEDAFPPVWATARMMAVMEVASARLLAPLLQEGQLSVGVGVQATHSAPTLVGETVRVTSHYQGRDGKLYKFEVTAHDRGGQVGTAQHTRAIISTERFSQTAAKRYGLEKNL